MKAITQWVSRPVRIAMVLPVLLFSGCVSHVALRSDYDDYSRVYADASNRQLLLNLVKSMLQERRTPMPVRGDGGSRGVLGGGRG